MSMLASASASARSNSKTVQNEHFFRYTSGRWLWDEEKHFQERYRKFNVEELKRIGAESIGAKSCVSITKLDEGGYNKVFRLVMDNGSVDIARIPCPNAGPPFKTTASEVATMDFARTILNIPVPKVHAWSAVSDNPVEAEYILMEEACGTSLGDVWEGMGIHSKAKIVNEIVSIEQKLLSVSFSRYGNIYFAKDSFPGCEKAEVSGDISEELKKEAEERFTIGPVVEHVFWRRDPKSMQMERGPWKTADDYLNALANNQVIWLTQESPDAHIALYKKYLDICPYILPKNERMDHMRDAEGFNEQADFWDRLDGFIARGGWTSNERYEEALEMFASIREEGLKQLTGEEKSDFEKQSRWAQRSAEKTDDS
ncbi:hypothetical protein IFR05_011023 [Cadophora sp. M221]|nr:hypothetical protein IFR05_011023 [Cadophora sp. M221]